MRVSLRYTLLAVVAFALAAATASAGLAGTRRRLHVSSTHWTRPLRTALLDQFSFGGAQKTRAFAMARASGASYVRLIVRWSSIAPSTRPAGFAAGDPASPEYDWSWLDSRTEELKAAGLTPILDVISPPSWAYAHRPHGTYAGTPKLLDLKHFARALALHFDGSHGAPAEHVFQIWNEPNLSLDLYPTRASVYRGMINAFARPIHNVSRANLVVAGALDPFGNRAKRFRAVAPLSFMRALLCFTTGNPHARRARLRRPHRTCKAQAHFDVWAHHPYTFDGPFGHARLANDVSLGDLPKMSRLLHAAVRSHRVVSRHPVQFWVTEFGWDTSPPRRSAAPIRLQSRWTSEALYQMWRSGVSLVTWYLLQDRPSPSPYQSGLYFHSRSLRHARAKPTREAFRFPFVAYRGGATVRLWGRNPTSTKELVTIQRRHGIHGRWRAVARIRTNRYGIFRATLRLRTTPSDWMRAVARPGGRSLAFALRRPSARLRYGPWGN